MKLKGSYGSTATVWGKPGKRQVMPQSRRSPCAKENQLCSGQKTSSAEPLVLGAYVARFRPKGIL
jgi:hypothetical protein